MSVYYHGYDHFNEIPLADPTERRWRPLLERCDPLLLRMALVGISAVKLAVEKANNSDAATILETGKLLESSGAINEEIMPLLDNGSWPRAEHVEMGRAGLLMVSFVTEASQFFADNPMSVEDYTGQTGCEFNRRVAVAWMRSDQDSKAMGRQLNTYPAQNIQAEFMGSVDGRGHDELTMGAALYGAGNRPWSVSTGLKTFVDTGDNTGSARIASGSRRGDFVSPYFDASFDNLGGYTRAMREIRGRDASW